MRRCGHGESAHSASSQSARTSLNAIRPEAREILDELLEKYAEHGDAQFVLPDVLRVPPISTHGQPARNHQAVRRTRAAPAGRKRPARTALWLVSKEEEWRRRCANNDGPGAREPAEVGARYYAQGQRAQRRPRPSAATYMDHVSEIPGRP